jgi:hypothetical protein
MSEGQSQRSITSSAQHRQDVEVATAEERERVVAETAATAARLVMAKLAAERAKVGAAAAVDAARAAAAELEALCGSSTSSSVSADGGTDDELKHAREAAGSTKTAAFTGGTTLPPRTGNTVTAGSRPMSGTSVPAVGGLPSPRPTTSSGSR